MDIYVSLTRDVPVELSEPSCVVVIDVVRSGTTAVTAMANGAKCIRLFAGVDEVRQAAKSFKRDEYLTAGERGSTKIEGFDCGNSPSEFTKRVVQDKTILMSTTNGPATVSEVKDFDSLFYAAHVNVGATARRIREINPPNVAILCAGMLRLLSLEDIVCAGALIECLGDVVLRDDGAVLSVTAFREYGDDEIFPRAIRGFEGGRRLAAKGMESDLAVCAIRDLCDFALQYDEATDAFYRVR